MNKLKETNGKYYQECEVVMLATNKNLKIGDLGLSANNILWYIKESNFKETDILYECLPQHLYFLNNEEIKEGDWCINRNDNTIVHVKSKEEGEALNIFIGFKKIIATTNTSLRLPQPSKEFIQAFITAYNEYEPITKVLVEMEGIESSREFTPITYQLKLNSSNEITIKKIKDSWTRKEMFDCWLYSKGLVLREETDQIKRERIQFNKWIEQNL